MAIFGYLKDVKKYAEIFPGFKDALDYLEEAETEGSETQKSILSLAAGEVKRVEIRGKEVFSINQAYLSKPRNETKYEAHRKYIDFQYIASGREIIEVGFKNQMTVTTPYMEDKDLEFWSSPVGTSLRMEHGMVAILFPEDIHMPSVTIDKPEMVYKAVVKLLIK